MSTDIRLMYRCPHVTFEERVTLDANDLRTALSRQPVAGSYVRVTANNNVIPSQGLYAPAKLYAAVAEPYGIISGETGFSLITSQESLTVDLPVSSRGRTSAASIIAFLQPLLTTATVEVSNGYLVITDKAVQGTQSFVEVTGDAASTLGFIEQRGATGRKVYPGWQLIQRGTTPRRYVQFTEKFKANPILKLSYTVAQNQCLRCRGTGVENDMRFNEQGEILTIRNENLLYQGSLKILLTTKGSNPFHTFYGTRIKERIGSKAVGAVAAAIREDIIRALGYYKQFQQEQGKYQQVTLKETLYEIASVQVNPAQNDPTVYYVDVVVRNASSEPVSLSIVYTVPGAVALMGD